MKINAAVTMVCMGICMAVGVGCVSTGQQGSHPVSKKKPDTLFNTYMEAAVAYEDQKNLPYALKAYTLARMVKPDDPEAEKKRIHIEAAIKKQAGIEFNLGLRLWKQGNFKAAREKFLTALRLQPNYPEPLAVLKQNERIHADRFIIHTIKPGDSLSKLAKKYYGSFTHFDIIAKYNAIENAIQIRLGQKIKVPEIKGLPFNADTLAAQSVGPVYGMTQKKMGVPNNKTIEPETGIEDAVEQTQIYRDQGLFLFKQREYGEAAFEFLKVLSSKPDDMEIRQLLSGCYFEQGSAMLSKNDPTGARKKFQQALIYSPNCKKCSDAFKESDNRTKRWHYTRGITFFEKEKLSEAIAAWRLVEAIDPGYKQVVALIKKAETILRNLKKIQQPGTN